MKNLFIFLFALLGFSLSAQFDHESVFSELEGDALRNALIENFKTNSVLTYSEARDTLFSKIDAVDNVLECVYTGFKITLDPNQDPTTYAFEEGINTEHTYPRSKGASENTTAYSDMHHLFPTREGVNSARGNLPFSDILDSQTDKWYFEDNVITSIPTQGIDGYSELLTGAFFEPREQHKGDVARAYFYFYTMYKLQADLAAPNYFELQRETMCQWHFDDPVDEKEWTRNIEIASYQDGKRNPFVLDCKLARLYCEDIVGSCLSVNIDEETLPSFQLRPNPASTILFFEVDNLDLESYKIYSSEGKEVKKGWIENDNNSTQIEIYGLINGFYFVRLFDTDGQVRAVSKFIKI